MDAVIILSILGIILFIVLLSLGYKYYKTNDNDLIGLFAVMGLLFIIVLGCSLCAYVDYKEKFNMPHNGEIPTLIDVANGEAHIDTLKASVNDTVQNVLFINWNDSIVIRN